MGTTGPEVVVGVPVFNGANYLRQTLEALLAQTFEDFLLVVSDNASTDATPDVCSEYATRDRRVRVIRRPENIGAAPNFNSLFAYSGSARYFKWAGHDDLLAKTYLARCVEVLDSEPDVVLCTAESRVIDDTGRAVGAYGSGGRFDLEDPTQRFRHVSRFDINPFYEIFGVFRCEALRRTRLIRGFSGGDGILLAEIALQGKVRTINEGLFLPRRHPAQSQRLIKDKRAYDEWFDPNRRRTVSLPYWRRMGSYFGVVGSSNLARSQALRCYYFAALQGLRSWRKLCGDLKRGVTFGSSHRTPTQRPTG